MTRIVDNWTREYIEKYRNAFGWNDAETETAVDMNLPDWRDYARKKWRREQAARPFAGLDKPAARSENPSIVVRQAREIRYLKVTIDKLTVAWQHEGQMHVEADRMVRALAMAHVKQQLLSPTDAGAIAGYYDDRRFPTNADLWEGACQRLHAIAGPDYVREGEREVERKVAAGVAELRKNLLAGGNTAPEHIANVLYIAAKEFRADAEYEWREKQRELRAPKVVPLEKDGQVYDLRRRIAALSRDVAAHQARFGKDPRVVGWLRRSRPRLPSLFRLRRQSLAGRRSLRAASPPAWSPPACCCSTSPPHRRALPQLRLSRRRMEG